MEVNATEVLKMPFSLEEAFMHLEAGSSGQEREYFAKFARPFLPLLLEPLHFLHLFLTHTFVLHLLLWSRFFSWLIGHFLFDWE